MKRFFWRRFSITVTKPLIDLLIVITGVTVAFLLSSWNENKKDAVERKKVLTSLEIELHELDSIFPFMADYQAGVTARWDSLKAKQTIGNFHEYRFIQPQYDYAVLEYALSTRGNIVDFELHQKLLSLYRLIKMLEQAEVYMTNLALEYQPSGDDKLIHKRNEFLFSRFIVFSKDRAFLLQEVSRHAKAARQVLKE